MNEQEFVRNYMNRRCVCGKLRSEHAIFTEEHGGGGASDLIHWTRLRVLAPEGGCSGFMDEIELRLQGNPETNPLLAELCKK